MRPSSEWTPTADPAGAASGHALQLGAHAKPRPTDTLRTSSGQHPWAATVKRKVPLVATPDCKTAVDRANDALTFAVRIRVALEQGAMVASGDPASFDRALAAYREVVDRCMLRAP